MAVFDGNFQRALAVESWTLYAFGVLVIALRMYARGRQSGFKKWAWDDYLMIVAMIWYTLLIVFLNIIASGGGNNLFRPEELRDMTKDEIKRRIHGSKVTILSEQSMLNVIYLLKTCVLAMYGRFMLGSTLNKVIKALWVYVAIGWVATQITFFTTCMPFSEYWAVPPSNSQCATLQHYAIVQACFNISSDLAILYIPVPMVRTLKVSLKQKLVLGFVFSMGIFVVIAAVLTKAFNLSDVYDPSYMLWYTREASVAVYVANLPLIWPLVREAIPCLRDLSTNESSYLNSTRPSGCQADIELLDIKGSKHLSTFRSIKEQFAGKDAEAGLELRLQVTADSELAFSSGDIYAEIDIEMAGESTQTVDALTWEHATTTDGSMLGLERFEK